MEIRKYRPEDQEEKEQLHLESIREVSSEDYSERQIEAWTTFDEENSIDEDNIERWVAEKDGDLIGFADYRKDEGRITGVYVHPDHLRESVGTHLLEKIVEDARTRGIEKLNCESSVTARDFYRSNGFRVVEEVTHETNGEELQAFEMEREI